MMSGFLFEWNLRGSQATQHRAHIKVFGSHQLALEMPACPAAGVVASGTVARTAVTIQPLELLIGTPPIGFAKSYSPRSLAVKCNAWQKLPEWPIIEKPRRVD